MILRLHDYFENEIILPGTFNKIFGIVSRVALEIFSVMIFKNLFSIFLFLLFGNSLWQFDVLPKIQKREDHMHAETQWVRPLGLFAGEGVVKGKPGDIH